MNEWPRWPGETAIVVATGPSAKDQALASCRDKARFIAIKNSWRLCPWADVLYGADRGWWLAHQGVHGFKGLKVSPSPTICKVYGDVRQVRLKPRAEIMTAPPGTLGCGQSSGGGHSGFQAVNLAVQFGAKRLVLVGFDMTLVHGAHWDADYRGIAKPDAGRVSEWRQAMDGCAGQFAALGIAVINCSTISALQAYPKMSFAEALRV